MQIGLKKTSSILLNFFFCLCEAIAKKVQTGLINRIYLLVVAVYYIQILLVVVSLLLSKIKPLGIGNGPTTSQHIVFIVQVVVTMCAVRSRFIFLVAKQQLVSI